MVGAHLLAQTTGRIALQAVDAVQRGLALAQRLAGRQLQQGLLVLETVADAGLGEPFGKLHCCGCARFICLIDKAGRWIAQGTEDRFQLADAGDRLEPQAPDVAQQAIEYLAGLVGKGIVRHGAVRP
ncbi:hypothetical protein D3C72_1976480 [compost metagenome]